MAAGYVARSPARFMLTGAAPKSRTAGTAGRMGAARCSRGSGLRVTLATLATLAARRWQVGATRCNGVTTCNQPATVAINRVGIALGTLGDLWRAIMSRLSLT